MPDRGVMGGIGRRAVLTSAVAAAAMPQARAAAKYRRYDVSSAEGRKALRSYAQAIRVMLRLPPQDPHNWFRNAFVHFMDCPHGNWWFYVWHRGYVGYLEQTVRKLSGDKDFAFPFWDWTALPRIPDGMFDGVLTPTDRAYLPYTRDIATFTAIMQPAMKAYWGSLTQDQLADQTKRGVHSFDDLWSGVTGAGVPGDAAFAVTSKARYLTAQRPGLDKATAYDCSRTIVLGGLGATLFYATDPDTQALSFNSTRTQSHADQPGSATWFSVLEGLPHNNVHNYIGGVGPWDPGPYGNMTNFLSPVDPVFFLHHANMDRLWDVWTRKQQALGLEFKPSAADSRPYMEERFRFFVDSGGMYLTDTKAESVFSTDAFDYDYARGTAEELIPAGPVVAATTPQAGTSVVASVSGNFGTLTLPNAAPGARLVAAVTLTPTAGSGRAFDVVLNAPPGAAQTGPGSPFFAGRIAFFGPSMHHMGGGAATFLVPLPQPPRAATSNAQRTPSGVAGDSPLRIAVVPAEGKGPAPSIQSITLHIG